MKYLVAIIAFAFLAVQTNSTPTSTTPKGNAGGLNKTNANGTKSTKGDDSMQNRMNSIATECKKELNAQQGIPEIMALLSSGALPTNEKQRCFLECFYKKIGLLKDGKINEEGAMSLAKAKFGENKDLMTKAEALFKKCKTEVVVDEKANEKCAAGRLIRTCIVNHGNNLPIFTKAK